MFTICETRPLLLKVHLMKKRKSRNRIDKNERKVRKSSEET